MPASNDALRYTETHEFVLSQGDDHVLIGLNPSIAERFGDILFIEAAQPGEELSAGDTFAVIGTQDGEIELNMPVSGTILSSNDELVDRPNLLSNDDLDVCWILEVDCEDASELSGLLTAEDYRTIA